MYACYVKHVMAGRERHFSREGEKLVNKGWIFFPSNNFLYILGSEALIFYFFKSQTWEIHMLMASGKKKRQQETMC